MKINSQSFGHIFTKNRKRLTLFNMTIAVGLLFGLVVAFPFHNFASASPIQAGTDTIISASSQTFSDSLDPSGTKKQICEGIGLAGAKCTDGKESADSANKLVKTIVNVLSVVVGLVAIVMIIFAGLKFITSAGGEGVAAAKKTIIYAIVGIVVVALAQFIVHFVLNKSTEVSGGSPTAPTSEPSKSSGPSESGKSTGPSGPESPSEPSETR